jgi:hypothetical protein
MPNLAELSMAVEAYQKGDLRLGAFEDWFRDNSRGMFASGDAVVEVCDAIEAAFSRYYFEGIPEATLREDLGAAIRPYVNLLSRPRGPGWQAHATPPSHSLLNKWKFVPLPEGYVAFGTQTGGNSTTTMLPGTMTDSPFWRSENATRISEYRSLAPV